MINTAIAGRDYQIRAIRAVLEAIEQKQRDFLLVMVTGTGKTRTRIALVDALMRASHAEKGTNTLIVKEFMEECIKDANGVLPGKTIFFCASKAHARRMEEIFDKLYPQYKGELAKHRH